MFSLLASVNNCNSSLGGGGEKSISALYGAGGQYFFIGVSLQKNGCERCKYSEMCVSTSCACPCAP